MVSSQARDILKLFRQQISHHVPPFLLKATWHSPQWWVPKLKACKLIQFTSAEILQTVVNSQVPQSCKLLSVHKYHRPPSCKLLRFERTKSCKLLAIHKYQNLANCCQVTSTAILQTALVRKYQNLENWFTSSQVPTSCKQSSIHKCQHLVNRLSLHKCQKLADFSNSQMPRTSKLLSTHKCQLFANCFNSKIPRTSNCCQFTDAKNLQIAPIHKCKELANCCHFTSAKGLQTTPSHKFQKLPKCSHLPGRLSTPSNTNPLLRLARRLK